MTQRPSITPIMLLEPQDLTTCEVLLGCFVVLKIGTDQLSQGAWNYLEKLTPTLPGICMGVIRSDWKETSTYFSQRYNLKHVTPQLALISRAHLVQSWNFEEILQLDLAHEIKRLSSFNKSQVDAILAFRMLEALNMTEMGRANWHKEWLEKFLDHVKIGFFQSQIRESLEQFCSTWQTIFDRAWTEQSKSQQAQFFEQAQLLHSYWWREMTLNIKA